MLKKLALLLCFSVLLFPKADAAHLMGGEITWDCAGGGKYIFTLKLYRDCNSGTVSPAVTLNVWFHPTITSIPLNLVSQSDISPVCNASGPAITCAAASSAPGW